MRPRSCPNCSLTLSEAVQYCPACGQVIREPRPPDHLVESVLTMVVCCFPISILALYQAMRVEPLYERGDIAGAKLASEAAARYNGLSLLVGLFVYLGLAVWFVLWLDGLADPMPDEGLYTFWKVISLRCTVFSIGE